MAERLQRAAAGSPLDGDRHLRRKIRFNHQLFQSGRCLRRGDSGARTGQPWLATKQGLRTGKPLNRISINIKNRLINLHCFFDRITEWGDPHPPQRPLVFAGDLPIVDKPAPSVP